MAINERLIDTEVAAAADNGGAGTGNQEEGLILHLDANDVDSYDGDGSVWYDIKDHEFTPAVDPSEHFNAVTYTGNGTSNSTEQSITGVGFQPDLVWIKNRGELRNHILVDSLRKTGSLLDELHTNTTDAANTTGTDNVKTMDSDGFTVLGQGSETNDSGDTFVAWCFKAGGAPTATNTATSGAMTANSVSIDGTLESAYTPTDATIYPKKISANTKLGFSTVLFTGTGNSNNRVPHGLGVPPELIIYKNIDEARAWTVGSTPSGWNNYLVLNETAAAADFNYFDDVAPTANVFEIYNGQANTGNDAGSDFIAYCFASKRGVSKVGSYVGTGASNKVYTGFEPAWIMVKRATSAGAGWYIVDNKRDTNTNKNKYISANSNAAEATSGSSVTFNTDGFTFNGSSYNTSGQTHIYLAFAAEKATSLIDDTDLELHLDPASYSGSGTTWTADTGSDATVVASRYDEELGDSFDISTASESSVVIPSGHPLNDNSFTLEFWFKSTEDWNNSAYGHNFIFDGDSAGWRLMYYETLGWILQGPVYTGYFGNGTVVTNKWHHVSLTYTGGTTNFYLDGELIKTLSQTRYSSSLGAFNFGSTLANNPKPKALVGQIRMYSSALTAAEVMQNYRFTKNDYPNGYNGTISGASWNSGGYFSFDGSNDSVTLTGLKTAYKGSYSLWFNTSLSSSNFVILDSSGTTNSNLGLLIMFLTDDTIRLYIRGGNGSASVDLRTDADSTFFNNTWRHLVVTWDAIQTNASNIYIDGVLTKTGGCVQNNWTTSNNSQFDVRLGSYNGGALPYAGKISDVKSFDKVLTSAEVTAQYNIGYNGIG